MRDSMVWIFQKHLDELSVQFRNVWDIYIKFYTAFLMFNVTGLALTIQYVQLANRGFVAIVFIIQNILCAITSGIVGEYSHHTALLHKNAL